MSKALGGLSPSKSKWTKLAKIWRKMTIKQLEEEYAKEKSRFVKSLIEAELTKRRI